MAELNIDSYGREIDYLRISVTDRCNLRCIYCMPVEGVKLVKHDNILRYEEIVNISQVAAEIGIRKIRLTGGEPLVRKGLSRLIKMLSSIPQIKEISMTTNGMKLAQHAQSLATAGLDRVNISMDTMRPERFKKITRFGDLSEVWSGIYAAEKAGLTPIKLNVIPMSGINDDEIINFALLTVSHSWSVRFIELMKFPHNQTVQNLHFIPAEKVLEKLSSLKIRPLQERTYQVDMSLPGNGPARYYKLPGAVGQIGIISPVTQHFCDGCNRMRLTADGKLRPCLLSESEIDLKTALRNGASDDQLREILSCAIKRKPVEYKQQQKAKEIKRQKSKGVKQPALPVQKSKDKKRSMWQIGG